MDVAAVQFAQESFLKDMGLTAKGDIFALKAFCQRETAPTCSTTDPQNTDYEKRKRQLLDQLENGRSKKKAKEMDNPMSKPISHAKMANVKVRSFSLGWSNFSQAEKRFIPVRSPNGGGPRKLKMACNSRKDDIIEEGKKLFFPDSISPLGNCSEFEFGLASYRGVTIPDVLSSGEPFSLQEYIQVNKQTTTRLYITTRRKNMDSYQPEDGTLHKSDDNIQVIEDPNYDFSDLLTSIFDDTEQPKGNNEQKSNENQSFQRFSVEVPCSDTANKEVSVSSVEIKNTFIEQVDLVSENIEAESQLLIGSSKERKQLLIEQHEAYERSLYEDQRKDAEKKKALQEKEKDERLELLRIARMENVPPEPLQGHGIIIAVKHCSKGKIIRSFSANESMSAVYYWVGSQSQNPENFQLFQCKGQAIPLTDPVSMFSKCTLYMVESDAPIPFCKDPNDPEVTFRFKSAVSNEMFPNNECLSNDDTLLSDMCPRYALCIIIGVSYCFL